MADKETARHNSIVMVHSITPDSCHLLGGSITGFSIVSNGIHAMQNSPNVKATSNAVMNMASIFSTCSNDQAGIAGVISGTILGICEPIENQCRVKANGHHILRDGDIVWMNNRNCLGIVKILFAKKSVILASPKDSREDNALANLAALHPDADVIDPSKTSADLSKYENVIVHGHGGQLMGTHISPEALAEFLNNSGFQGNSIELAGCQTGTPMGGNAPYAERLAKILGIPVTGYPHEIMVKPGGIVRRIEGPHTGWRKADNVLDSFWTQAASDFGRGDATPKTFPGK